MYKIASLFRDGHIILPFHYHFDAEHSHANSIISHALPRENLEVASFLDSYVRAITLNQYNFCPLFRYHCLYLAMCFPAVYFLLANALSAGMD